MTLRVITVSVASTILIIFVPKELIIPPQVELLLAHAKAETEENSVRRQALLLSLDLVVKDITAAQGLNIKIMMIL